MSDEPQAAKADMHGLAILCLAKLETPPPPVMYILRDGTGYQAQDYFAHWGPVPYLRADTIPSAAYVAQLRDALAALILNIDAGGATLGAMHDARAALGAKP